MTLKLSDLRTELFQAIEDDKLTLPTLPEVAIKVREEAADPEASVSSLSDIISSDAALSARLIKVSNNPLLRGSKVIETIKMAINRLGLEYTSNLAVGLAMEQMFQATNASVDKRMRETWSRSAEVAGIANVLCSHYTKLKPDQASLAGLIHKIGALPILKHAEECHKGLLDNPKTLDKVLNALCPEIGEQILSRWGFSPEIIAVTTGFNDFKREVAQADYADIVMIANLQSYAGSDHPYASLDCSDISAFDRLGLPRSLNTEDEDLDAEMEAAMALLSS